MIKFHTKVQLIDRDKIKECSFNPKVATADRVKSGIIHSVEKWGHIGALIVSAKIGGYHFMADGNLRLEVLDLPVKVPCVIVKDINTNTKLKEFVLEFDRHRRYFDDDKELQLLDELYNKENIEAAELAAMMQTDEQNILDMLNAKEMFDTPGGNDFNDDMIQENMLILQFTSDEQRKRFNSIKKAFEGRLPNKVINICELALSEIADWKESMIFNMAIAALGDKYVQ